MCNGRANEYISFSHVTASTIYLHHYIDFIFIYHIIITSYFTDKECIEEQCEQLQIELEHRCKGEQRQEQIMATERSKASMLESKVRHEYDLI